MGRPSGLLLWQLDGVAERSGLRSEATLGAKGATAVRSDPKRKSPVRKADDGAAIAAAAAELQDELDRALLDALMECERQSTRLRDLYEDLLPSLDDDLIESLRRGFARIEDDQSAIGEAMGDITALKDRIKRRKREIDEATDETERALLESLLISDLLEKNLLILKALLLARESLARIERSRQRLTTI
jgi:hypothetical protein